ncbi:PEP-CTERM sorting domain-containing protein [Massilia solisilvae]|uniref:PEP-CTERM sorting domain-containing protein n=1 Tax=Massilia solisilvae TaxID=1811225 RepID=A0ABT2BKU8_9BURK|nr:PEP-CTERM sorting domain-containing protein [Massilia solisilvae]MCS0608493.1 PEP-CTERM sorting domain-containing protein [Massilia solisilvae]
MSSKKSLLAALVASLMCCPLAATADPIYNMLFVPDGFDATRMNNAGNVVGTFNDAAAIWTGTSVISFSATLPNSVGYAINNHNDIGGSLGNGNAFSYVNGVVHDIGALGGWYSSYVRGLNDSGVAIGVQFPQIGEGWRGFVYNNGSITEMGTFGGDWSWLNDVNNAGVAVGTASLPGPAFRNPERAVVYRNGAMQNLGTLGTGDFSEAWAINDAGQIVGWSTTSPDESATIPHPFLYQNGVMSDLGSLGGYWGHAWDINSAGVIVGDSDILTTEGFGSHAFIYLDGKMVDLNTLVDRSSGWEMVSANDVNDAQQILGTACRLGTCVKVRLDLISPIPEPSTWAMLLAGLALAGLARRVRARRLFGPLLLLSGLAPLAASADPLYTITVIPIDGDIMGINNAGQIVGGYRGRGFIWDNGQITELPTLGGPWSRATGINDNGVVIGDSASGDVTRGFVYENGNIRSVGALTYWGSSYAKDINSSGQVVGRSEDPDGPTEAFLYSNGHITSVGNLYGFGAAAYGINDHGAIVGGAWRDVNQPTAAFLYQNGTTIDLGSLGGQGSWAYAINNAGQVVGDSTVGGATLVSHAFLFSDGVMHDIGPAGVDSHAVGINNYGDVIGWYQAQIGLFGRGFLYTQGEVVDLTAALELPFNYALVEVNGINDKGQIIGEICSTDGFFCENALLTPVAAVPEPQASALLLAGLFAIGLRRRRARAPAPT